MSETYPTDSQLRDLSGATDGEQEVLYVPIGESPYYTSFYKMLFRLLNVSRRAGDLRVYKDGALTFGVRAGKYFNGDSAVNYAGATGQSLTNNQTNYIYLTAAGTLTVNTTGFPVPSVTAHIPLATITTSAGDYSEYDGDVVDYRGRAFLGVCGASSGSLNLLDWQESVADELDFTSAEPGAPSLGDRYLNTGTGAASGTGQTVAANDIEQWNGTNWTEITPSEGAACMVEDRNMLIGFNGSSWVDIGTFALLNEAQTFFGASDISGAEAETLTDGSNADSLHTHLLNAYPETGIGITDDSIVFIDAGDSNANKKVSCQSFVLQIAGDGLRQDGISNCLAVDVSDFAGTGLEDDGTENLRIAAAAAGDGLQGGAGSALAVDVSDFAGTGLEDDGSENLRIADGGVTAAKLASAVQDVVPYLALSGTDDTDGTGTMDIQAKDAAGNDLAERFLIRVWIADAEFSEPDAQTDFSVTTGEQMREIEADADYEAIADATGLVTMNIDTAGDKTVYVMAEIDGRIYTGSVAITGN